MSLEIDFYSDWIEILRNELVQMGHPVPAVKDPHEIALMYFDEYARRVKPKPRKVWKSKEFQCPMELQAGLDLLETKVIAGGDLTPHLSRKILKPGFQDGLLNDWGIQHFHLGTQVRSDGLIESTKEVLFARVTETDFYEIRIAAHGTWPEVEMMEILHSNWPETIRQFRSQFTSGANATTAEVVRAARAVGVLMPIRTHDGTLYYPLGGGIASDGSGSQATETADTEAYRVKDLQEHVVKNIATFKLELVKHGYSEGKPLKAKLVLEGGKLKVKFPDYDYAARL
jgi:hypothetical protein